MNSDPILDLGLHTTASALELLAKRRHHKVVCCKTGKLTNRRESTFFLHAGVNLPLADEEGKYFPGMTNVAVPYKVARKYVTDVLRYLEARGARIRVQASTTCIFIG